MIEKILKKIEAKLVPLGFKKVDVSDNSVRNCILLLKRQNFNTNRTVAVIKISTPPTDISTYLKEIRNAVAKKVKFIPFFWGVGVQVVLICPGISSIIDDPVAYVAKLDNQFAIIQSVYFFDPVKKSLKAGRTWGQYLSAKFQDAILEAFEDD